MGHWTRTPNAILDAIPDMKMPELRLTMLLVKQTYGQNENGRHYTETRLTYEDMIQEAKLSRGSVNKAIDLVEQRGFFRRGRKSSWCVTIDLNKNSTNSVLNSVDESTKSELSSTKETKETVHEIDQNSTNSVLNSVDESTKSELFSGEEGDIEKEKEKKNNNPLPPSLEKPKGKNKKAEPVPIDFHLQPIIDTPQIRQLLADFEANRREMNKPLTQRAADLLTKRLGEAGEKEAAARLQAAIINNWQGVFFPGDEAKYAHLQNGANGHGSHSKNGAKTNQPAYKPNGPEHEEYFKRVREFEAAKQAKAAATGASTT